MDELEFRRKIMTEPNIRDADIMEATRSSENNAQFLDDVLALDKSISKAMNVDVPDDLAERILLNQAVTENKVIRPTFTRKMVSMAASVAFVAGLLAGQVNWGNVVVTPAQASLATTALEHVHAESPFTDRLDEHASPEQLNMKLQPFHYQFEQPFPYHVYYLNHCGFGSSNALHAVFAGDKGRVTLFVTNIASDQSKSFDDQGLQGMVIPMNGSSMIIVGQEGENVAKIAEKLEFLLKPIS
ncbi:DUF3379 domain-containing protein [Vibrio sp. FNV 38]|nr:DUF3379 domain-containing protein [Vibrio sp. FNV 38]